MKRVFTVLMTFLLFFGVVQSLQHVNAQNPEASRYATCDVCGFCITKCQPDGSNCVSSQNPNDWPTPPGDWAKCAQCLYPSAYPEGSQPDPRTGGSLLVDPSTNIPAQPAQGRYYTVFGCVKTQLSDFTQTGAASSLIQVLLNVIFALGGGIAILFIVYGSFLVITSQADPERLAYGKRVILGAVIGLVIVLSSVMIINFLASGILKLPGFDLTPTPTP